MFALVTTAVVLALVRSSNARGAGRAFPIMAENYAIDNLQNVNPSIEWDPTNYLIDRSGEFANCRDIRRGYEDTVIETAEGGSIGVVLDYIEGYGLDVDSANENIKHIVDKWMRSGKHNYLVRRADIFGCSVRPGCDHESTTVTVVACLFSPGQDEYPDEQPEPTVDKPIGGQNGLAFTPEQYDLAAAITGIAWDRSHFLENLSGYETSCSMLGEKDWRWDEVVDLAAEQSMLVTGLKGEARNNGDTQEAMERILRSFKEVAYAPHVGCSIIPDCVPERGPYAGEMWVVVACVYEERQAYRRRQWKW